VPAHEAESRRAQAECREIEERTRLLTAEGQRAVAEATHIESQTGDLDFAVFRKGVLFVLAIPVVVVLIVRLLADPGSLSVAEGAVLAAIVSWIIRG
jgi:hypothetical protein